MSETNEFNPFDYIVDYKQLSLSESERKKMLYESNKMLYILGIIEEHFKAMKSKIITENLQAINSELRSLPDELLYPTMTFLSAIMDYKIPNVKEDLNTVAGGKEPEVKIIEVKHPMTMHDILKVIDALSWKNVNQFDK